MVISPLCLAYLGLLLRVDHFADNIDGDVVCAQLCKNIVCHRGNFASLDDESGLLQGFTLGTFGYLFAILEMATGESP